MTDAEILDLIRRALNDVVPDRSDEWNDLDLSRSMEDLSLSSIDAMEMVNFLEDETDVTFPDEELPKVNHLSDLARLLRGQRL